MAQVVAEYFAEVKKAGHVSVVCQKAVRTLNSVLGCGEHQKCFWHVTGKKTICRVKTTGNTIRK